MFGTRGRAPVLVPVAVVAMLGMDLLPAQELEDIVVTAQRREQDLQEVGVSVTAFTGDTIREYGFTNTVDITAMTPGLNYTAPNAEGSQINFFLRGVGLNDFADAQENPVAVYVDDVYKPAMGGLHLQLFDMERVEVLRGPQGALFGRNTTGGVIHYISKRPTEEFEGYADLSFGDYSKVQAEGAISGALAENILARLSLAYNANDGYTQNRTPRGQDFNGTDATAARLQLQFLPTERLSFLITGAYSENDTEVGAWQHESTRSSPDGNVSLPLDAGAQDMSVDCNADGMLDAADMRPGPGTDCFGYRDTDNDLWGGDYDRNGRLKVENQSIAVNAEWQIGDLDLTWITAYTEVDRLQEEDTEMNPFLGANNPGNLSFVAPTFAANTETWSTEFRVANNAGDRLRYLGGFYYFDNSVVGDYFLDTSAIGFIGLDADYIQEAESWALFGQVEFDFTDALTLILGLRYTDEEKTLDYQNIDRSGIIATVPGSGVPIRPTPDFAILFNEQTAPTAGSFAKWETDYVTGNAQLNWNVNEEILLYGKFSRGQKSPGFNNGFLDITGVFGANVPDQIPFREEELNAFELGFKSTLWGNTRLNAAAFYYDYKDFQTFQFVILNQVIFNTDAEVFGGELEIVSSPWEGWDISLGMSARDPKAQDIPTLSGDAKVERNMVAAPEFSLNAAIRYEWPAFGGFFAVQAWAPESRLAGTRPACVAAGTR